MKKLLLVMLVLGVMMFPLIAASEVRLDLVQKNPADWSTVNGATAEVIFSKTTGAFNTELPLGDCSRRTLEGNPICKKIWFNTKEVRTVYGIDAKLKKAEPKTDYTLIWYGYDGHNDVWPYASCISSEITNKAGNANFRGVETDSMNFLSNNIPEKYWIVLSSDVDCTNHKMIAWNPTKYLFETRTL